MTIMVLLLTMPEFAKGCATVGNTDCDLLLEVRILLGQISYFFVICVSHVGTEVRVWTT